jgi:hypothetical protein
VHWIEIAGEKHRRLILSPAAQRTAGQRIKPPGDAKPAVLDNDEQDTPRSSAS